MEAGHSDIDILLARIGYKLASVLYKLYGQSEEVDHLSQLSTWVLEKHIGSAAPKDSEAIDEAYNNLLFYWNR